MSKIPCDIIKDLLPLYEDHICSEQSKDAIEEHLIECESCREYLEAMQADLPSIDVPSTTDHSNEEAEFLRRISHKLTFQKGILCGILLNIFLILSVFSENHDIHEYLKKLPIFDMRLKTESIQVDELYQLDNGDLYCTIKTEKPFTIISHSSIESSEYDFWESYDDGWNTISLRRSLWNEIFHPDNTYTELSFVVSLREIIENEVGNPSIHESNAFYYEGKGDERLLIWKEGQKLESAPYTIEEKVEKEKIPQSDDEDPIFILY